jgi:6-phosphogluconolactonase
MEAMELTIDAVERLAAECARRFERAAATAIAARGAFSCALPGGSVARTCFPVLAGAAVDWSRTHVFWGDERAVPREDPQSNYGLAVRLLLSQLDVPAGHVHRIPADEGDLSRGAERYEAEMLRTLGDRPRIDLVLLGAGADGHVCSLFPGHPALDERARAVVAVFDAPKPPARRLTLTLPVLSEARSIVVCAFGQEKANAIHEALRARSEDRALHPSPLALATRDHPDVTWLLDPDAAALVKRP